MASQLTTFYSSGTIKGGITLFYYWPVVSSCSSNIEDKSMDLVDPFAPTASERFFEAREKLYSFPTKPQEDENAFDAAMRARAQERADRVNYSGFFEIIGDWLVNMFSGFLDQTPSLEDTLADIVIVLLETKPSGWRFTEQAKFDDMHVIVNDFTSPGAIRIQMRTMDHKTFYPDIKPSKKKRRELVLKLLQTRDYKILDAVTAEVKKQVFMITDQRQEATKK